MKKRKHCSCPADHTVPSDSFSSPGYQQNLRCPSLNIGLCLWIRSDIILPRVQSHRGPESPTLTSWELACARNTWKIPEYRNSGIQRPELPALRQGSNLEMGINGKGSRAKIAHAVKHTCLLGCWNASVLGSLQGHTALLPRQQLSAILLCPVLLQGAFVRRMGKVKHPAKMSLTSYPMSFAPQFFKMEAQPLVYFWERDTLAGAGMIG